MKNNVKMTIDRNQYIDCIKKMNNAKDIDSVCHCIEEQFINKFSQLDLIINGFLKLIYDNNNGVENASFLLFDTEIYFKKLNNKNKQFINFCKNILSKSYPSIYFQTEKDVRIFQMALNNQLNNEDEIRSVIIIANFFDLLLTGEYTGDKLRYLEEVYGNEWSSVFINKI